MANIENAVVTIRFTNPEVIVAVRKLTEIMDDIAEDMPWREDVKEAVECLRVVQENIRCVK